MGKLFCIPLLFLGFYFNAFAQDELLKKVNKKLDENEKIIATLRNENDRLKEDIEKIMSKNNLNENKLKKKLEELHTLKALLQAKENQIASLMNELNKKKGENIELEKSIIKLGSQLKELQRINNSTSNYLLLDDDIGYDKEYEYLAEKLEMERLQRERVEAERRLEMERLQREQVETERRLEMERLQRERVEAERRLEMERLQREQAEAERKERDNRKIQSDRSKLASQVITKEKYQYYEIIGGIENASLSVTNKSDYLIDKVIVDVEYIRANGNIYKTETVTIRNLHARDTYTTALSGSPWGQRLISKVKYIYCSALNWEIK